MTTKGFNYSQTSIGTDAKMVEYNHGFLCAFHSFTQHIIEQPSYPGFIIIFLKTWKASTMFKVLLQEIRIDIWMRSSSKFAVR